MLSFFAVNTHRRLQLALLHSRLTLDFSSAFPSSRSSLFTPRLIHGTAELVYQPLAEKLRFITFCRRGYTIDAVHVDGVSASESSTVYCVAPGLTFGGPHRR